MPVNQENYFMRTKKNEIWSKNEIKSRQNRVFDFRDPSVINKI